MAKKLSLNGNTWLILRFVLFIFLIGAAWNNLRTDNIANALAISNIETKINKIELKLNGDCKFVNEKVFEETIKRIDEKLDLILNHIEKDI